MTDVILAHEPAIRLVLFLGVFACVALAEIAAPRRTPAVGRWPRWINNLGIVVLNTILLRVLFLTATVGVALRSEGRGWGLLNNVDLPGWVVVVLAVIALDLAIYLQHVLFHAVPALWRVHRMHHADLDFDLTTGARFHPIEVLLSFGIKLLVVVALGAPAIAVLVFEVLLSSTSMFNHGNIRLPDRLDRVLRLFVVTPDMHRVHHSILPWETNSNFGFNLPWWDRALGSYRAQPAAGHEGMTIGIEQFRMPRDLWIDRMLVQPFRGHLGKYSLRRVGAT